jgi:cell division protease FtsH
MTKTTKYHAGYAVAAVIGIVVLQYLLFQILARPSLDVAYSQFRDWVNHDQVAEVSVSTDGSRISGVLKKPLPNGVKYFVTTPIPQDLAGDLERHGVKFTGVTPDNFWSDFISWTVPTLLFFALWQFAFRSYASKAGMPGLMSIGKSKAKIYVETDTKTTFADVAGANEAKEELKEIVGFLKDPERYARLGGRVPKGVLLVGPPGTGKTLLARAVAGEASVPFFSISGSEFVEMFVGVGAARVRDLFEQARERAPAIIFIDELDALGRARAAYPYAGGNDEKEQTLNQLLVELDGFDPRTGLVLLAATNRPEILDPALLRAGRFDRQILVDRPDKKDRVEILQLHLKKIRVGGHLDPERIAELTVGLTGADIANLVNEAALLATRRGADAVEMEDFTAAAERIYAGLEKRNRVLNPNERKVVAYHEMGHALVALSLPGTDRVHKVSIIPRGIGSLGYTIQRPTEDRFLMTREELENKMAVLLGGRAAEQLVFGTVSTGAADDLQKVTDIARSMVTRYGMAEELGPVTYESEPRAPLAGQRVTDVRPYSENTSERIDQLVQRIVESVFNRTKALLKNRREVLEQGATLLLTRETLTEDELLSLVGRSAESPVEPSRLKTANAI